MDPICLKFVLVLPILEILILQHTAQLVITCKLLLLLLLLLLLITVLGQ